MHYKLILVAGYAACGKTHVGKELAQRLPHGCYLDKDTLTGPFADRLLQELGQPPGDRDSDTYREHVRPLEYECLLATGIEAAHCGAIAILCAPFLAQLADAEWMRALKSTAGARQLPHRIVWVHCDRAIMRERMIERASRRDRAKIDDWQNYSTSIDEHFPSRILGGCFVFNNSYDSSFDDEMERLLADVMHGPTVKK